MAYPSYALIPLREWSGQRRFGDITLHLSPDAAHGEMHGSILRTGHDPEKRGFLIVDFYGNVTKFDANGQLIPATG